MTGTLPSLSPNGGISQAKLPGGDDPSDATPTAKVGTKVIDDDMMEKVIKFEFVPLTQEATQQIAFVHVNVLLALQTAFGSDLVILDNKSNVLGPIDTVDWVSPARHQRSFTINCQPGFKSHRKTRYVIQHRIRTNQSISTLKNFSSVNKIIKTHNAWMKRHFWCETILDIAQAGYLLEINPAHYSVEMAEAKVKAKILAKTGKPCPPFKLVYASPNIKASDGRLHRTKAYSLEFQRSNSDGLMRALKTTFNGSKEFIFSKFRYTHPKEFTNAIKYQNSFLKSIYVIPLLNCTAESLFYFEAKIKNITGVREIIPSRNADTTGRFNILVHEQAFKSARAEMIANFEEWYMEVPNDARPHPDAFSGRTCIGAQGGEDDQSTGDHSFMSMSALSFSTDMSAGDDTATLPSFTPTSGTYAWGKITQPQQVPMFPFPIPAAVGGDTPLSELTASHNSEMSEMQRKLDQIKLAAEQQAASDAAQMLTLQKSIDNQAKLLQTMENFMSTFGPSIQSLAAMAPVLVPNLAIQPPISSIQRPVIPTNTLPPVDPITARPVAPVDSASATDPVSQPPPKSPPSTAHETTLPDSASIPPPSPTQSPKPSDTAISDPVPGPTPITQAPMEVDVPENAKRSNDEEEERSIEAARKRVDARPSPQKQDFQ